jgi:Conserved in the green lineage and diatoms 27
MKEKIYKKLYCPVPEEQRPLNEYLNLKNSLFFNWPSFSLNSYVLKLNFFSFIIFILSLPISNYFYYFFEFPIKFIFLSYFLVLIFGFFLLIRIYLGWSYINQRLNTPFVKYEESGWYDCQIWIKSIKILKQDRLISYYKVLPILKRLRKTMIYYLITCLLIFVFNIFL